MNFAPRAISSAACKSSSGVGLPPIRLTLAQGIALALEFKMGGEVLRTVVVREWAELGILGAIIILRGALTFLIHWEINNEKKELIEMEEIAKAHAEHAQNTQA